MLSVNVTPESREVTRAYGPPETVPRYTLYPTIPVLVLAIHERLTLCCTGATPLPVSDSVTGELPALLTNENVAVVVPDTCGRKVTVNGIDCPAASVVGREIPLNTNSVLVLVTEESVTEEPLAVSVPLRTALEPSVTLPKLNAVGVNDNCPEVAAVPESPIFSWESDALERIAMVPEAEPDTIGENTTPNVRLCPAARLAGSDSPLTANDPLDMLACEIDTFAVPVFVSVSVSVCEAPGGMLPKLKLCGDGAI